MPSRYLAISWSTCKLLLIINVCIYSKIHVIGNGTCYWQWKLGRGPCTVGQDDPSEDKMVPVGTECSKWRQEDPHGTG